MAQVAQTHDPGRLQPSFDNVKPGLPLELVFEVLEQWMAPQSLVVEELPTSDTPEPLSVQQQGDPTKYLVVYACVTDAATQEFPQYLRVEYWRLRHLSWLKSPKAFTSPFDFYMSHHLLSLSPRTLLPPFTNPLSTLVPSIPHLQPLLHLPHPRITTHGLEHIILDFDASQYFALFSVCLPPFNSSDTSQHGDSLHHDTHLHGAASLLQHCTHLTLVFGEAYQYAHPWLDVRDTEREDARTRPRVCEMGKVVDWILEAVKRGGWLDGKDVILEGGVQGWVREKWEGRITEPGQEEEVVAEMGRLQDVYPPACECEIGCWTLGSYAEAVW